MATIDTNFYTRGQPTANEKNVNVLPIRISLSLSASAGDIHRIAKIPHGAIPLDAVFIPGSALPANGAIVKFGTSASNDLFFLSASLSVAGGTIRTSRPLGYGQQISVSDDKMPRYEAITMVSTATLLSVGYMGDLILYYTMPGQTV